MLPSIEQLLVVQDRDRKMKALNGELATVPTQRLRVEGALKASAATLESVKSNKADLEVRRKRLELDVKSRQDQLARYKGQQMQTRKNEEFQALGNEIARAEKEIVNLEDQELELMEEGERVQAGLKEAERAYGVAKTQTEKELAALKVKEEALKSNLKALDAERSELARGLDADLLFRYTRLFASKGGDALVPIEHEVCMGCHMKNTATVAHRAKRGLEVVTCEQCGRLLYWDGE